MFLDRLPTVDRSSIIHENRVRREERGGGGGIRASREIGTQTSVTQASPPGRVALSA